jgi:hypothetical protein
MGQCGSNATNDWGENGGRWGQIGVMDDEHFIMGEEIG